MFARSARREFPGLYAWYRDNLADACAAVGFDLESELDKHEGMMRRQRRKWRKAVAKGDPAQKREGIVQAMIADVAAKSGDLRGIDDEVARLAGLYDGLATLFSIFFCQGPAFAQGSQDPDGAAFEGRMRHVRLFVSDLAAQAVSRDELLRLEAENPMYRIWLATLTIALKRIDGVDEVDPVLEAASDPVTPTAPDRSFAQGSPSHESPPRLRDPQRLAAAMGDHYPSRALREGLEGKVGFRAEVNAEGRVDTCTVERSCGHAVLDEATCKLVRRAARFDPARGASGEAVPGEYSGTIAWRLG